MNKNSWGNFASIKIFNKKTMSNKREAWKQRAVQLKLNAASVIDDVSVKIQLCAPELIRDLPELIERIEILLHHFQ